MQLQNTNWLGLDLRGFDFNQANLSRDDMHSQQISHREMT
ncbi:MAG: hypothetical protein F6K11_15135 [Leptolyngbya sp. SIO3F4]|nr:hypothetical protein [Leptolyngbya sp. SIO3F4]